ncbi:hypothetical protein NDU88_005895 [Pleurodeles waltl]|uniref:Uncharacterized protein n=1 Tax=Pleurodeles waltl TaxID=8319 RepID=A0AAV7LQC9_PLEWA|nr:hypothetical protein NDU88_005895 [Pleurodeles waltl]
MRARRSFLQLGETYIIRPSLFQHHYHAVIGSRHPRGPLPDIAALPVSRLVQRPPGRSSARDHTKFKSTGTEKFNITMLNKRQRRKKWRKEYYLIQTDSKKKNKVESVDKKKRTAGESTKGFLKKKIC